MATLKKYLTHQNGHWYINYSPRVTSSGLAQMSSAHAQAWDSRSINSKLLAKLEVFGKY